MANLHDIRLLIRWVLAQHVLENGYPAIFIAAQNKRGGWAVKYELTTGDKGEVTTYAPLPTVLEDAQFLSNGKFHPAVLEHLVKAEVAPVNPPTWKNSK